MIQDDNNINISYWDNSNGFLRGLNTREAVPVPYSVNGYEKKIAEDNARLAAEEELLRQRYMESTFRDDAGSPKGARGAYQVMPGTHREYVSATGKDGDLNDYSYNKAVRDWYISKLSKSRTVTNGNPTDEVRKAKLYAAYNWGQGNLGDFLQRKKEAGMDIYHSLDWVNDLPDETRNYVNFIVFGKDIEGTDKTIEAMNKLLGRDSSTVAPPPVPDNTPQQPLFFDAETGKAVVIPQSTSMNSYDDGGRVSKVDAIAKRINETSQADFVKRLIDKKRKVIHNPDGTVSTHELGYVDDGKGNAVVFPEVQSSGDSLKRFPFPQSYERAVERGDTVHMSVPDAELFTKEYKSVYPGFNSYWTGGETHRQDNRQEAEEIGTEDSKYASLVNSLEEARNLYSDEVGKGTHDDSFYAARRNYTDAMEAVGKETVDRYAALPYIANWAHDIESSKDYLRENGIFKLDDSGVEDWFSTYSDSEGMDRILKNQKEWYNSRHPYRRFTDPSNVRKFKKAFAEGVKRPSDIWVLNGYPDMSFYSVNGHGSFVYRPFLKTDDTKEERNFTETLGHEYTHGIQRAGHMFGYSKNYLDESFRSQVEALEQNSNTEPGHDSRDVEKHADIEGIKYLLYKEGIYDARGSKDITTEEIKKLRDKYPNLRFFKQVEDNEKAAWLINNVASASEKNTSTPEEKLNSIVANYSQDAIREALVQLRANTSV